MAKNIESVRAGVRAGVRAMKSRPVFNGLENVFNAVKKRSLKKH